MVLVNGIESSQTSAFDRGLLYGQSVFETIAIRQADFCLLDLHLQRLIKGCKTLSIPLDCSALKRELALIKRHLDPNSEKAVLRLSVTMGEGGRGYLNPKVPQVNRILSLHDYPQHPKQNWISGIILGLSEMRLASQPVLAGIKHGNRLEQVMARSAWQAGWQEALLCDYDNNVIEATQSNVFLVKDGIIKTPLLHNCGVAGVMREHIIEQAQKLGFDVQSVSLLVSDFFKADEIFVSNSIIGLWPVRQFQDIEFTNINVASTLLKSIINNEVIPNF